MLFYLDSYGTPESSETATLFSFMQYNPENNDQNKIIKQISSYMGINIWGLDERSTIGNERIGPILSNADIPQPEISFILTEYQGFISTDTTFFSSSDIEKTRYLLKTQRFRTVLKTIKSHKRSLIVGKTNFLEDGRSILEIIRDYYPQVKLLYEHIGIVGTALETGWNQSVTLNKVDHNKNIWEANIFINDGEVKFRSRDSWNQNWGGMDFPKGQAFFFGKNIKVTKGEYHVILNLEEGHYEFISLDD